MSKTSQPPIDGDQALYESLLAWSRENPVRAQAIVDALRPHRPVDAAPLIIQLSTPTGEDNALFIHRLKERRQPRESDWQYVFDPHPFSSKKPPTN